MTDESATRPVAVEDFEIRRAALVNAIEWLARRDADSSNAGTVASGAAVVDIAETFRVFLAGSAKA